MRLRSKVLGLPASIVLLVASYSETTFAEQKDAPRWPFGIPGRLQWPGFTNRKLEIVNEVEWRPQGVLKMSSDEGEKFYMEYWQGAETMPQATMLSTVSPALRRRDEKEEALLRANSSIPISYRHAFAQHTDYVSEEQDLEGRKQDAARVLGLLQKRQFSCPTGTASCSAIGFPNSCCATDETCFQITNTGLGSVGCCPNGASCGGTITTCNAPNTACPDNSGESYTGGGCCIPDFVCAGVGCVLNSTSAGTTLVTSTSISPASTSLTVITIITPATATVVVTAPGSESTSSYTGLQTTLACSTSSHACPVGMGGGCCGDSYACASSSSCSPSSSESTPSTSIVVETTSSATGVIPVRPTGSTTTSTTSSSITASTCPVGFYACEAYYAGGCCRTGRNCDTTSCPATSSSTIVSSGVTIVVPVGSAASTAIPTGNCASGWATCAASLGGNCCPSGYACGTASCSLVDATTTAVSPKEAAGSAGNLQAQSVVLLFGLMVWMFCLTEDLLY